jgi:DNA end-binding protein Ku
VLKFGGIRVSVKGYSAAVAQRDSPLHLVHVGCGCRIQQPRRCPKHGEIASDQITKAFEFGPTEDVVLSEDELDQIKPVDNETIHIEHLLPAGRIDVSLLSGRTLNLIPAHPAAVECYQLVVAALAQANEWAIGRIVMSDRWQPVGLHVVEQRLVLHVLHWPAQWRSCPAFVNSKSAAPAQVERFSASLTPLRQPFAWSDYRDDFDQKLSDLVGQKMAARKRSTPVVVVKDSAKTPSPRRTTTPRSGRAA